MFVPMVAHATTSPLPLLSPEDKRLLRIYFRVGQSIQALADELISLDAINRSSPDSPLPIPHSPLPDEFDLATWATSDQIAPHIAYRKQELADARREEALKELTSLVKHSGDALERRRAATNLLRMLSTQLTRNRAPSPASPAAGTGGGRGARAAGGEGSVTTSATHSPSRETPATSRITHDSSPPPSASSAASSPHSPLPTPPPPDSAAPALLRLTLYAIMSPKDLTHRAALEPHLAPQATINHEPILNLESQLSAISPKFEVTELVPDDYQVKLFPGPPESRTSICTLYQVGRNNRYLITLTRAPAGAHANRWLISAIEPIMDTS